MRPVTLLVVLLSLLTPLACRPSTSTSCSIDDGPALDVRDRGDGIYGVVSGRVEAVPLAKFDSMHLTGTGVDTDSGKRWVGVQLDAPGASAVKRFTSGDAPRGIAVVADGELASAHKVREPIESDKIQISCCNPKACDRWLALLDRR